MTSIQLYKTEEQILQRGIELLNNTPINPGDSSGKVVRLLLNIINSELAGTDGLYKALEANHMQAFLSTATGTGLDKLAEILNCFRLGSEDDDNFKYRISQKSLTMATSNFASIKLAALSVTGVQDLIIKENVYGTGSFVVYVISDTAVTSDSILSSVRTAVDKVRPFGTKFEVLSPEILYTACNVVLSFDQSTPETDRNSMIEEAKATIVVYLNKMSIGASLNIRSFLNNIILSDSTIKDAYLTSLVINNKSVFIVDQKCRWNQRFLASTVLGEISVQGEVK